MARRIGLLLFLFALLFSVPYIVAQVVEPTPSPTPGPGVPGAPDLMSVAVQAIYAITPVLAGLALWALRSAWNKVPAALVVFLAPLLGMAVNFGLMYIDGHTESFSPFAAAAMGMIATYMREFISTLTTKGTTGPITVTKLNF